MFIQILQGRVADEAGVRREAERWHAELAPDAPGWLGLTAGIGDDRTFVTVLRFDRGLHRQPHLLEMVVGGHEGGHRYFTEVNWPREAIS